MLIRLNLFRYDGLFVYLTMNAPDPELLKSLVTTAMPFGKYKGTLLCDLPDFYLEWFARQGFPPGKLGMQLSTVFEIKQNGLHEIISTLKRMR